MSCLVVCKSFLFISDFYRLLFGGDRCCHVLLASVDPKLLQPVGDKENSGADLVVCKSFSFISDFYLVAIAIAVAVIALRLASCSLNVVARSEGLEKKGLGGKKNRR